MNRKYILIGLLVCITGIFSGCRSWLDVQPEDQVTDGQLFSTESGFRTALNGIYVELSNNALYGGELSVDAVEILAQRYDFSGNTTNAYRLGTYNYTIDYAKSKFAAVWEKAYSLIANCNKLLEYAEKNEEVLTGKMRKMIIGEAMALRAFLHFDMLRLFGPVYATNKADLSIPYNTVYSISATSLLPATQVVEKVLKDLDEAERLLGESDPIIEEGPQNQDSEDGLNYYTYRTQRLNYYAVKALKARVYLWADNKAEAYREAKAVTAVQEQWFPWTERREIMDNTRNPDRIFSSELLFAAYYNAREEIFTNYFSPTLEPAQVYSPKKHIDDLFTWDLLDWRNRPIWLEGTTRDYRCFHKYEDVSSTEVWTKLIPLIRMTEMYYIIAETATDETEALDALNTVLFNRGVKELEDKTQLAGMLRDEYRREFFGEGQLFFYYKRLNVKVLHSYSENADLDMDAAKYVVPLPLSETDFR